MRASCSNGKLFGKSQVPLRLCVTSFKSLKMTGAQLGQRTVDVCQHLTCQDSTTLFLERCGVVFLYRLQT